MNTMVYRIITKNINLKIDSIRTVIILCIILAIRPTFGRKFVIEASTNTYTGYGTVGVQSHLRSVLNPGDEVETGARTDTAVQLIPTAGVNEGQTAWTALSNLTFTIDEDETYPLHQIDESLPYSQGQIVPEEERGPATIRPYTPVTDEEIWEGAAGANPTYILDVENYDGGDYLPFYRETTDAYGTVSRTTHYVRVDPGQVARLQQATIRAIRDQQSIFCEGNPQQGPPPQREGNWIPACEVLQKTNLGEHDQQQLSQCMVNIRAAIQVDGKSRTSLFENLYSKLNSKEQEFAAMVFTSFGEGRSENHADKVMIMKVLENRARYAQERGHEGANELDAALQPWQFSMYNENDRNWKAALLGEYPPTAPEDDNQNIANTVASYLIYKDTNFDNDPTADSIYHYHTPGVNPDWSDSSKRVHPSPNGESPSTHKFFRNVAWSFANNDFA